MLCCRANIHASSWINYWEIIHLPSACARKLLSINTCDECDVKNPLLCVCMYMRGDTIIPFFYCHTKTKLERNDNKKTDNAKTITPSADAGCNNYHPCQAFFRMTVTRVLRLVPSQLDIEECTPASDSLLISLIPLEGADMPDLPNVVTLSLFLWDSAHLVTFVTGWSFVNHSVVDHIYLHPDRDVVQSDAVQTFCWTTQPCQHQGKIQVSYEEILGSFGEVFGPYASKIFV